MAMPTGNGENPQVYGQWTIDDCQNWLFAEGEESTSMDFQVCQPQKTRVLCHLKGDRTLLSWTYTTKHKIATDRKYQYNYYTLTS